jgi:hypothetical protein
MGRLPEEANGHRQAIFEEVRECGGQTVWLFEKRRRRFLEREIGGSVEARAVDSEREM